MMFTSDPNSWTAPSWHPDFGDAKTELEHLRTLALALQVRRSDLQAIPTIPEPGTMYLCVSQGATLLAEVYWRERESDYAVFVFTLRGEIETYAKTEEVAAAAIFSK